MSIKGKDTWIIGVEENGAPLWPLALWSHAITKTASKKGRIVLQNFFSFEGDHVRWFTLEEQSIKNARILLKRQLKNPNYLSYICRLSNRYSEQLQRESKKWERLNVTKLTNKQLASIFIKHKQLVISIVGYGVLPALMDIPRPVLSDYAVSLLDVKIKKEHVLGTTSEYFEALTAQRDESIQAKEKDALAKLVTTLIILFKGKSISVSTLLSDPTAKRAINKHTKRFGWAYYGYAGPALSERDVAKEIIYEIKMSRRIKRNKQVSRMTKFQLQASRRKMEQKLKLSRQEIRFFDSMREIMLMKIVRRDAVSHSFYALRTALEEVACRFGVHADQMSYITPDEIITFLRTGKRPTDITSRRKFVVIDSSNGKTSRLLSGAKARQFVKKHYKPPVLTRVKELKGQPACLGKARGNVRIVNVPADMKKMKNGDILVSASTTSEIISAMKKAAAIVTDMGGITSHAAIVSRELNVPCVIGTKVATLVFKDGDKLEVDATHGLVIKL